jgi:hypothetical protein
MPESTIAFSTPGTSCRNRVTWSWGQKPMTRSTPARSYQLRSKITTSPPAGRCGMYRCRYICDCSRPVGAGRATTRNTHGLTRSVIALMVPPFPAVSLPSNTTQTFAPEAFTHACIATSSPCGRRNSRSYCFLFILACGFACAASAVAVWPSPSTWFSWPPRLPSARPRLGTPSQRHVLLHEVTGAQPPTHVKHVLDGQRPG